MPHPVMEMPIGELTIPERLALLGRLWDSLLDAPVPPIPQWHLEEVRRRVLAADANPSASIPLDELRKQLKRSDS